MVKLIPAAAFAAGIVFVSSAAAQGVGLDSGVAAFGTRLPARCGPFMDALATGPTAAEAAVIFQCREEADNPRSDQRLHLWEDIRFERLGETDPIGAEAAGYVPGTPAYAFEGTATHIVCSRIADVLRNAGKNCDEHPLSGQGLCFFTVENVWRCEWAGESAGPPRYGVAPR